MRVRVTVPNGDPFEWTAAVTSFRVGRAESCALRFQGPSAASVSWEHAEFQSRADGATFITDLGSKNGTYVNDARITQPTLLAVGARIRLGRTGAKLDILDLTPVAAAVAPTPPPVPDLHPPTSSAPNSISSTPSESFDQQSSRRSFSPRRETSGTATLVGYALGGVIGLALGYYVLCTLQPERYNVFNLPVPSTVIHGTETDR
jgi:pSer/pThr/pTyr-binding forkhead associated (FHA) protein